jgi:hypothetical protein
MLRRKHIAARSPYLREIVPNQHRNHQPQAAAARGSVVAALSIIRRIETNYH